MCSVINEHSDAGKGILVLYQMLGRVILTQCALFAFLASSIIQLQSSQDLPFINLSSLYFFSENNHRIYVAWHWIMRQKWERMQVPHVKWKAKVGSHFLKKGFKLESSSFSPILDTCKSLSLSQLTIFYIISIIVLYSNYDSMVSLMTM